MMALGDWLHQLWEQAEMRGQITQRLLTPAQALYQWEKIISASAEGERLLKAYDTAKTAATAWGLIHQWCLIDDYQAAAENVDHETFAAWANSYQDWCNTHQCIDEAQLISALCPIIETGVFPYAEIQFLAFERLPPQLQQLCDTFASQGVTIQHNDPVSIKPDTCVKTAYEDAETEAQACAHWAKAQMQAGKKNIAVIVPNLPERRTALETCFQSTVDWTTDITPDPPQCEWLNFSAAIPLGQYPLIQEALLLIQLGLKDGTPRQWITALNSPLTQGYFSDLEARDQACAQLKQGDKPHIPLIDAVKSCQQRVPKEARLSEWIVWYRTALETWGWPGERVLNSTEHQVMKRWQALLEELTTVALVDEKSHFGTAFRVLQNAVNNLPFQPERRHAAIQVLGTLEASGQTFDAAWVLGLHRDVWPEHQHPNPFIAQSLQRQLKMPHACPTHELQYATQVLERFKQCAKEIVFSYPQKEKGRDLLESPLIGSIPFETIETAPQGADNGWPVRDIALEHWSDDTGPIITENLSCGTQVLALQAACPFKAFAETRLDAVTTPWQTPGLDPAQKGILMHALLEALWLDLKDQATLRALSNETRTEMLQALIEKTFPKAWSDMLSPLYVTVEKQRLLEILQAHCQFELQRSVFQVVATEWSGSYQLEHCRVRIRIDRVDRDANNRLLLIDYKTGAFQLNRLWEDRLESVQLPIYYLSLAQKQKFPQALMVVQLDLKEITACGVCDEDSGIEDLTPTDKPLAEHGADWQQKLQVLVDEYRAGDAAVRPNRGEMTCQYCDLSALCRKGVSNHV